MRKDSSYSFVEPEIKPIFSIFSKICISLIIFVSVILILGALFIDFRIYQLNKAIFDKKTQYNEISNNIDKIKINAKRLGLQRDLAMGIYSSNNILKKSLKNIFDLVPDTITLSLAKLEKNSLIIKGKTPSKDTYELLLEAPLRSVFTDTQTSFYQLPNGWYNFVSVSKIDQTEGFNE